MTLTDQEQVVLKAIDRVKHGDVALIADVIKAIGYPKATTKKALISLLNKGAVSLHRHDYPSSLKPEQRKLLVRIKGDYFNAVSMKKRNPKSGKGKTALRRTGRALKGFARGALSAGAEILGAGASALNPRKRKRNRDYPYWNIYHIDTKKSAPYDKTFLGSSSFGMDKKEAIEKFRRSHYPGRLRAGTKIIAEKGIVSTKNPHRRIKVRNKYIDLVIKGQAKKTPDGWRVGKKTFAQGRGTVSVSSGYYLDRHTGTVYAKRERNKAKKKKIIKRVCNPRRKGRKPPTGKIAASRAKASRAIRRKPSSRRTRSASRTVNPHRSKTDRARVSRKVSRKAKATRSMGARRKTTTKRAMRNPSAESIRKEFAGRVTGERDVFVPSATPKEKLAKLGNLVLIQTEQGTIKPVHGSAVLLADTRGKLHIGTTSKADLFNGPRQSFGEVKRIEYDSSKPHLGFPNPIIWHHRLGEESGHRPTLHADGQGGLVFRGGRYRLTRRGIEN